MKHNSTEENPQEGFWFLFSGTTVPDKHLESSCCELSSIHSLSSTNMIGRKAVSEFPMEYTNSVSMFVHIDSWYQNISPWNAVIHRHTLTFLTRDASAIIMARYIHRMKADKQNAIQNKTDT